MKLYGLAVGYQASSARRFGLFGDRLGERLMKQPT